MWEEKRIAAANSILFVMWGPRSNTFAGSDGNPAGVVMDTQKPVRRTDTFDELGLAVAELQGSLRHLWEAVTTVEAVDACRAPEPEQHANAMTQLSEACQEWQGSMVTVRDLFLTWMQTVSREQQQTSSGQQLLKAFMEEVDISH